VDRDNFLAEVPDIVPACVASVHEFWRNYQKPPPSEAAASREAADASDATTGINQQLARLRGFAGFSVRHPLPINELAGKVCTTAGGE
jgi:hypothetical protein